MRDQEEIMRRRQRRISDPDSFDTYFQFDVRSGDISKSRMEALLNNLGTDNLRSELTRFIEESIEKGLAFLERLRDHVREERVQRNALSVVSVLFDVGDRFPQDTAQFPFKLDGGTLIMQIVYQLLRGIDGQQTRFTILTTAMSTAQESLGPLVKTTSVEASAHGRGGGAKQSDVNDQLVDDRQLDILEQQARRIIEEWAKGDGGGRLANHPQLAYILYRWAEWGDRSAVEDYILHHLDAVDFARLVAQLATNAGMPFERPTLDSDSIRALADPGAIVARLRVIMSGSERHGVPRELHAKLDDLSTWPALEEGSN